MELMKVKNIILHTVVSNELLKCPGLYCGRTLLTDGYWSECKACDRGFRTNSSSACVECTDSPVFYDWLYLVFMALISLILHWYCIDRAVMTRSFSKEVLILHLSALLEIVVAGIITLLISEPVGSLNLLSCRVEKFSDWYTLFHNPNPDYEETLHCTQEAVYPLYTIVFIFYSVAALLMLLVRPVLVSYFLPGGKMSIYGALYFFPILVLIQAVFAGVLYYSFPYIVIVLSVISNAAHFALKPNQESIEYLILSTVTDVRNLVILLGHWMLHAYGIIAITQLQEPVLHLSLLALVPLPALFYILTSRFTDPSKLHND